MPQTETQRPDIDSTFTLLFNLTNCRAFVFPCHVTAHGWDQLSTATDFTKTVLG